MILEIFRDSFEYTLKDTTILKLGILFLLSPLIIPIIILSGYSYRIILIGINSMINSNNEKPNFDNIKEMLIQGIETLIIGIIYNLPSIIATYVIIVNNYAFTIIQTVQESRIDFHIEPIIFLVVIWFITLLFTSVAIPHTVSNNGSLKAGFNIKDVLAIIREVGIFDYLKFSLLSLIMFIGVLIIIFILIQVIINLLVPYGILLGGLTIIGIYIFLGLYLIAPLFLLLESRAIALIYNTK